ncbi:hypothetical protein KEM56_006400 [Ascosphaera pollenicola]|nr:hypothetical protein KEM56_006400 [Ascosphaera pollenicola]
MHISPPLSQARNGKRDMQPVHRRGGIAFGKGATSADTQSLNPEFIRQQQEQIRALLRAQDGAQPQQQQQQQEPHVTRASEAVDDTEMDILNKLLSGNPNVPGAGIPGLGSDSMLGKAAALFAANGAPGFGQNTPQEKPDPVVEKSKKKWKFVHFFFGLVMVGYFLFTIHSSLNLYATATAPVNSPAGDSDSGFNEFVQPPSVYPSLIDGDNLRIPPPATMQSPIVIFLLGELMLTALRGMLSPAGFNLLNAATWNGLLSDVIRDAKIVIFGLGISSMWWHREAEEAGTPKLSEGVWSG